jgi:hypothetical protein
MVEAENRARIAEAKGGLEQGESTRKKGGEEEGTGDTGEGEGPITKISGDDGGGKGGTTITTAKGGITETAKTADPPAVSETHGYGHQKMVPVPTEKTGVATRGTKRRKSNEQGEGLSPGDKDGPGKAGATGTLVTVTKKTPNWRNDTEYGQPQKEGTGEAEMAEGTTMSQFDPIVEEEQEEDDARVARNTAEGTGLHPPNVAPPDDVEGGGPRERPTRLLNTERADKAKGKGGPEKPKEPEK